MHAQAGGLVHHSGKRVAAVVVLGQALEQHVVSVVAAVVLVERFFRMLLGDDELVERDVAQLLMAGGGDGKDFAFLQMFAQLFREGLQIGVNEIIDLIEPARMGIWIGRSS
jgi:hypothetical protein